MSRTIPWASETARELARRGELGDLAVREAGQRGDRVRGGVEDQLPPLGASGVLEGVSRHPAA
jgi:hypothetical protein